MCVYVLIDCEEIQGRFKMKVFNLAYIITR